MTTPIRVLIVDNSPSARRFLAQGLASDPRIDVVGVAEDAYGARDKIVQLRPQVMTLDVEMPRMDGIAFLRRLMPQYPLPVIMVSAMNAASQELALEALEAGALDIVAKPIGGGDAEQEAMLRELRTKIKIASTANVSHWRHSPATVSAGARPNRAHAATRILAIGASTGGTEAIRRIMEAMPADGPAVVIVQHMPAGFTAKFAERLDQICPMRVKEAAHGDCLTEGLALVAPGERQLRIVRLGNTFHADVRPEGPVSGHCPSVDAMLFSLAQHVGCRVVAAILTGMGKDGAAGLQAVRQAGGRTLAQDEATSVVFGMPGEAWRSGAAEMLVPLDEIADRLLDLLGGLVP